jgi:hypothetical protein
MSKKIIAQIIINNIETYTIDKNLIRLEFEDLDRGNSGDLIDFGIYANRGSLTFTDNEKLYLKLSQIRRLETVKVRFLFAEKNLTPTMLKTFIVQDFDIDKTTNTLTLQLISSIIKWQELKTPQIYMFRSRDQYVSLKEIIDEINTYIPRIADKLKIHPEGAHFFSDTYIDCPYFEPSTVWDLISKICVFCGGRICEDRYGQAYITNIFTGATSLYRDIMPFEILNISNVMPAYKNVDKYNRVVSVMCKQRERKYGAKYGSVSFRIYDFINNEDDEYTVYIATRKSENPNIEVERKYFPNAEIKFTTKMVFEINPTERLYEHSLLKTKVNLFNYVEIGPIAIPPVTKEQEMTNLTPSINFNRHKNRCIIQNSIETQRRYDGGVSYVMDGVTYAYGNFFVDGEDVEKKWTSVPFPELDPLVVPTNELFQSENYIYPLNPQNHGEYYAQAIHKELSKDTLECECIYFDSPREDDSKFNFSRVETVRPFVIENGNSVPFDKIGTNKYIIIGVKYSFSGIIRQTLYLQKA